MMKDTQTDTQKILVFLESRPAIAITRLEVECQIPRYTIHWAKQKGSGIPQKHMDKIKATLARYGYTD